MSSDTHVRNGRSRKPRLDKPHHGATVTMEKPELQQCCGAVVAADGERGGGGGGGHGYGNVSPPRYNPEIPPWLQVFDVPLRDFAAFSECLSGGAAGATDTQVIADSCLTLCVRVCPQFV